MWLPSAVVFSARSGGKFGGRMWEGVGALRASLVPPWFQL